MPQAFIHNNGTGSKAQHGNQKLTQSLPSSVVNNTGPTKCSFIHVCACRVHVYTIQLQYGLGSVYYSQIGKCECLPVSEVGSILV